MHTAYKEIQKKKWKIIIMKKTKSNYNNLSAQSHLICIKMHNEHINDIKQKAKQLNQNKKYIFCVFALHLILILFLWYY